MDKMIEDVVKNQNDEYSTKNKGVFEKLNLRIGMCEKATREAVSIKDDVAYAIQ